MSPEQAQGRPVDARSDIYSLGCVLFQMLTGALPFQSTTPWEVIRQHIEVAPRSVRELNRAITQAVEQLVNRCLAKDANQRYQSAGELAQALTTLLETMPRAAGQQTVVAMVPPIGATRVGTPVQSTSARGGRGRTQNRSWMLAAVGVVALLAAMAASGSGNGSRDIPIFVPPPSSNDTVAVASPTPTPTALAPAATPFVAVPTPQPTPTPAPAVSAARLTVAVPTFGNERFDPAFSTFGEQQYNRMLHSSLIATNEDSELIPGIAKAWQFSADGKSLLFTIREGVKFHNGTDMSTEDVLWSLQHSFGPQAQQYLNKNSWIGFSTRMNSIRQVGPQLVIVTFNDTATGFSEFISEASISTWGIMPRQSSLHDESSEASYERNPVGAGPMKLVRHIPAELMEFQRFDGFYYQPRYGLPEDRRVQFGSLDLRFFPEEATRIAALRAGVAEIVSTSFAARQQIAAGGGRVIFGQEYAYLMGRTVGCWDRQLPCSDLRVRQALAYAIDKEAIRDALFGGPEAMQVRGWTAVTPSTIGYSPDLDPFPYDPAKAKLLLAEAGYPNGFKLTVNTWNSGIPLIESAQAAAGYWQGIGIDVQLTVWEPTALRSAIRLGEQNGSIFWRDNEARLDASGIVRGGYADPSHIRKLHEDPGLLARTQAALAVQDPIAREQALNKLYQRLRSESYDIGMGYVNIPWGVGSRVSNWQPYPLAFYPTALHTIRLR